MLLYEIKNNVQILPLISWFVHNNSSFHCTKINDWLSVLLMPWQVNRSTDNISIGIEFDVNGTCCVSFFEWFFGLEILWFCLSTFMQKLQIFSHIFYEFTQNYRKF